MKLLEDALNDIPESLRQLLSLNAKNVNKSSMIDWEHKLDDIYKKGYDENSLENILILCKGLYYEEGKWLREKFGINEFISDNYYDKLEDQYEQITGNRMEIGVSTNISNGEFEPHEHQRVKGVSQHKEADLAGTKNRLRVKGIENTKKLVSEKLDGSSLYIVYNENGELVQGVTRGDGTKGFDITINIKGIKGIPLKIDMSEHNKKYPNLKFIEIRGEALVSIKNFEELNLEVESEGNEPYQNTRNMMGGVLMSPYSQNTHRVMFKAYQEIIELSDGSIVQEDEDVKFKNLENFGFETPWYEIVNTFDEIEKVYIDYFNTKRMEILEHDDGYAIDGLVVSVNDSNLKNELGMTNRRENGSFAIKFPSDMAITKIRTADFTIGKSSGNITPRGLVQPVDIGGVIVQKASLANKDLFENFMISEGDSIVIRRSGDVIPQIIMNKKFEEYYDLTKNYIDKVFINLNNFNDNNNNIMDENIKLIESMFIYDKGDTIPLQFEILNEINKVIRKNLYSKDGELLDNPKDDKIILSSVFKQMNTLIKKEIVKDLKKIDKDNKTEFLSKDKSVEIEDIFSNSLADGKPDIKNLKGSNNLKTLNEDNIPFITSCPSCGSVLIQEKAYIKCVNEDCAAIKKGKIMNFITKNDIKGIGDKTIDFLYDNQIIKDIPDLFSLKREDFVETNENGKETLYEGWGERSIEKTKKAIESLKNITDIKFLGSLSIPMYGRSRFETILEVFDFKDVVENRITKEQYQTIQGLKDSVDILIKGLDDNKELIDNLLKHITVSETEKMSEEDKEKIKIYLTGSIKDYGYKSKKPFFEEFKNFNFDVKFSKSACDLLLTSEISTKIDKAKKWNMPIIEFKDFIDKIDKTKNYNLNDFLELFSNDNSIEMSN